MSSLEIDVQLVAPDDLPPEATNLCKPGIHAWGMTVACDDETATFIQAWATAVTNRYPAVLQDLDRESIPPTRTFPIVHALEHLVVLSLFDDGFIPREAIDQGNVGITIGGVTVDGQEIAAFWLRQGLIDEEIIHQRLLTIIHTINQRDHMSASHHSIGNLPSA